MIFKNLYSISALFFAVSINACEMHEAVREGDMYYWRSLISNSPLLICSRDAAGMTPLHWAAYWGRKNLMHLFTEAGSNVNSTALDGNTPLHWAVANGQEGIVSVLLDAHALPNIVNRQGLTPMHIAILKNNIPILKILLQNGAQATIPDAYGATPLHLAAFCGNQEAAELLIGAGALVSAQDGNGDTPVDIARKNDHRHLTLLFSPRQFLQEWEQKPEMFATDSTVIVYNLNMPIERMWVVPSKGILQIGQPRNPIEKAIWEINIKKNAGPYIFSLISQNRLYQWLIRTFEWPDGDQLMLEQRIKDGELQLLLKQTDECSEFDIQQIQPALHDEEVKDKEEKSKYPVFIIPIKNVIAIP
jgi:hypothetical protein